MGKITIKNESVDKVARKINLDNLEVKHSNLQVNSKEPDNFKIQSDSIKFPTRICNINENCMQLCYSCYLKSNRVKNNDRYLDLGSGYLKCEFTDFDLSSGVNGVQSDLGIQQLYLIGYSKLLKVFLGETGSEKMVEDSDIQNLETKENIALALQFVGKRQIKYQSGQKNRQYSLNKSDLKPIKLSNEYDDYLSQKVVIVNMIHHSYLSGITDVELRAQSTQYKCLIGSSPLLLRLKKPIYSSIVSSSSEHSYPDEVFSRVRMEIINGGMQDDVKLVLSFEQLNYSGLTNTIPLFNSLSYEAKTGLVVLIKSEMFSRATFFTTKAAAGDTVEWVIFKSQKYSLIINGCIMMTIDNPFSYKENKVQHPYQRNNQKTPEQFELYSYVIMKGYLTSVRFYDMVKIDDMSQNGNLVGKEVIENLSVNLEILSKKDQVIQLISDAFGTNLNTKQTLVDIFKELCFESEMQKSKLSLTLKEINRSTLRI